MDKKWSHASLYLRMPVGVMGSAGGKIEAEMLRPLRRLGAEIARRGYVLITGARPSMSHEIVNTFFTRNACDEYMCGKTCKHGINARFAFREHSP